MGRLATRHSATRLGSRRSGAGRGAALSICPVCGFPGLTEPPRSARTGSGSYEICPACGFEFGVTDDDNGYTYEAWRSQWVDAGMPWTSSPWEEPPAGWDPGALLEALVLDESERVAESD